MLLIFSAKYVFRGLCFACMVHPHREPNAQMSACLQCNSHAACGLVAQFKNSLFYEERNSSDMICFTSNRSAIGHIHLSVQKLHTKTYHWIHQMCAPPSYVGVLIRIIVKLVCTSHLQSAHCPTPFFPCEKKQPVKNKSNVRLHWWIQMSQKYKNKKLTAVLNMVSTETLTVSIIAIISALISNLIWWKTSISSRISGSKSFF